MGLDGQSLYRLRSEITFSKKADRGRTVQKVSQKCQTALNFSFLDRPGDDKPGIAEAVVDGR